ncbi:uncharacterized protein PHACADRAFT_252293 [Phanerochaete carnosa HHB-10118-sp]|uniref:Uncharacterized protein n=1 Tax=Phanerochaete carnosa (strain HHB-10118-sp) TaxID=650164 RepID=K5X5Q0_PHACS|nr:uncharacterized protein PHACADRAFT_252293 [Phanerochaete carnosa HHB-10118-sp]EKM58182.1 hypothetical protein PHACADRAFT_252293 [Phanerochaete carnosa HHB-10118-sp]
MCLALIYISVGSPAGLTLLSQSNSPSANRICTSSDEATSSVLHRSHGKAHNSAFKPYHAAIFSGSGGVTKTSYTHLHSSLGHFAHAE